MRKFIIIYKRLIITLNLQNSKEPLSIVHQIAKIGFDKIKDELAKSIKNKKIKIINHLK